MDYPLSIPRAAVRLKTIRRGDRIHTPDGPQIARYVYFTHDTTGRLIHLVGTQTGQEYSWDLVEPIR